MRKKPNFARFARIQVPVGGSDEGIHTPQCSSELGPDFNDANEGKDTNDAKERTHWIKVTTSPAAAQQTFVHIRCRQLFACPTRSSDVLATSTFTTGIVI